MLYFAKSTNGFYDSEINPAIPIDAVTITPETWQSLFDAQSEGKTIKSDDNGRPIAVDRPAPTNDQMLVLCKQTAQNLLDSTANNWGYDSMLSAATYTLSTNSQYKADAQTLVEWRDSVWAETYTILKNEIPESVDSFLAMLPVAPTQPTIG